MIDKVEYLEGDDGVPFIRIISGEYSGICVKLGAISFPDEDEPVMQFQYDIIEGSVVDAKKFEVSLGDFIVKLLQERIEQRTLLFKGGQEDKS